MVSWSLMLVTGGVALQQETRKPTFTLELPLTSLPTFPLSNPKNLLED